MSDLTLLWIDLTRRKSKASTTRYFDDYFKIRKNSLETLTGPDETDRPVALCFDYDFPNSDDLRLLTTTKRLHPTVPVLMLTVQHSEELAVWSFRSRVWDYFVKPVKRLDVQRCYESLTRIDRNSSARQSVRTCPAIPPAYRLSQAGSNDEIAMGPAIAYVQSHYSERITLANMADLCGMSTFGFSRAFHKAFGQTFQEYLVRYRIEQAERLLLNPALNIIDVGYEVGFRDASYFGRVFRRLHNLSPTQWREQQIPIGAERPCLFAEPPGPPDFS